MKSIPTAREVAERNLREVLYPLGYGLYIIQKRSHEEVNIYPTNLYNPKTHKGIFRILLETAPLQNIPFNDLVRCIVTQEEYANWSAQENALWLADKQTVKEQ